MKIKTILSLALLGMVTAVNSAPYSATGAGSSTIGTTGTEDYASLNAAVGAINTAATRDASTWTFLITTDLTEPTNSFLGVTVDPAGAIVFKPAPTTAPVITFTNTADNNVAGVSGNFIIGTTNSNASIALSLDTPTRNITIDGSNTVGGTTRDLTITNSSTIVHSFSSLLAIAGDSDNITVKNTNIINANTGLVSNVSGISVRPRYEGVGVNALPDNTVIENNLIRSIGSQQGVAINVNSSGTLGTNPGWNGYTITRNTLEGRIRGMFMNPASGGNITNNIINIGGGGTTNTFGTFGIIWNAAGNLGGTVNILGNDINVVTDNQTPTVGPTGMFLGSLAASSVINVVNNEITVESNPPGLVSDIGVQLLARGIHTTSGLPFNIYNNSVRVKQNGNITATQMSAQNYGLGGYALATTAPVNRANVVSVTDFPGAAVINANVIPTVYTSDYNILNAGTGVDVYARRATSISFHNRAITGGVATISTGSGTTAQAHTITVGEQVVIQSTAGNITFNNREIISGTATLSSTAAHGFTVGDKVFVNSSLGAAPGTATPNPAIDGVRTITAVPTGSAFQFATTGADLPALGAAVNSGVALRLTNGIIGGPYTVTAVTPSSFSFATTGADIAALGTAANQGNVFTVVSNLAARTPITFNTLAAYQTALSVEANSDALNPDVAGVAPDTGKWTSASSLLLDGKPGLSDTWGAPVATALADATAAAAQLVDIQGQTRATVTIYRGADELVGTGLDLPVTDWAMY
jgi:hypothetical protein